MTSKARLPFIAMLGALLLHASAVHAREDLMDLAPAVEPLPRASDPPQVSVPGSGPTFTPLQLVPASPVPPLSLPAPKMIHEPRRGLLVTGVVMFLPAYVLQTLLAFGVAMSGIDGPPGNYGTAGLLTLLPIVGPWVGPSLIDEPLGSSWALAWGAIEAGAIAMFIAGLIGHDVPQQPAARKVSLAPFATLDAGGLSLRLRW